MRLLDTSLLFVSVVLLSALGCQRPDITGPGGGVSIKTDAGLPGADASVPRDCEQLGFFGACERDTLIYCDENEQIIELDCQLTGLSCALVNGQYGYDCTRGIGELCVDEEGAYFCPDGGACVSENDGQDYFCSLQAVSCQPADEGGCVGDFAVQTCQSGFGGGIDCAASGLRCENGACVPGDGMPGYRPNWPWVNLIDGEFESIDVGYRTSGDVAVLADGSIVVGAMASDPLSIGPFSSTPLESNGEPFLVRFSSAGAPLDFVKYDDPVSFTAKNYVSRVVAAPDGRLWVAINVLQALEVDGFLYNFAADSTVRLRMNSNLGVEEIQVGDSVTRSATLRTLDIEPTASGGVLVAGLKRGPGALDFLSEFAASHVVEMTADFGYSWHREVVFGNLLGGESIMDQVETEGSGSVYWGGTLHKPEPYLDDVYVRNDQGQDIIVTKLDRLGNVLWTHTGAGGGDAYLVDLEVDQNGFSYGVVHYRGEFFANPQTVSPIRDKPFGSAIISLDRDGAFRWLWDIPGANVTIRDIGFSDTGYICATGSYDQGTTVSEQATGLPVDGADRGFVARIGTDGVLLDADTLADGESIGDGIATAPTPDGGCAVFAYLYLFPQVVQGSHLMKYAP